MLSINRICLGAALTLFVHAPLAAATQSATQASTPQGFEALAADPFSAGIFATVPVVGGEPARAIAQNIEGRTADRPFVNVLRWVDARPFRSKLLSIKQRAQLRMPAPDTQATLWVRVVRSDGAIGYADNGLDQTTSSSEWTTLESIGAIADDATDLYFGLLVEGTTPVNMTDFSIGVRGAAREHDLRLSVPSRWIGDLAVKTTRVTVSDAFVGIPFEHEDYFDHWPGRKRLELRVTTFRPEGFERGKLPTIWFVRYEADPRRSFREGRALLAAMRLGREPLARICFVEPVTMEHAPLYWLGLTRGQRRQVTAVIGSSIAEGRTQTVVGPSAGSFGLVYSYPDQDPDGAHYRTFAHGEDRGRARALMANSEDLNLERVALRWASAIHQAHTIGDPTLIGLLFDASIESMEPWPDTPLVRHASHSMAGHSHTHVHADGTTHTHSF